VRSRPLALFAISAAAFSAAAALAWQIGYAMERPYDVAFVPEARAARWISLGHPTLAANLNWLRAVQYAGEPRADERGWEKLRPLLELVTDLDPKHGYAYQVGANFLSAAGLVADANAVLEQGIRNVPDRYILPFHRAVNAFLYAGDYEEAGRWFEIASRTPGAPAHLREYVVAMYVKGDVAGAAISFLEQLRDAAQDDESRKAIEGQIRRARYEGAAEALDAAVARYRERRGTPPGDLHLLVSEGLLPALPHDPYGGRWVMGEDGRVRSSAFPQRYARPLTGMERDTILRQTDQTVEKMRRSIE
jgi:tetratricopeptide (TPR) repeat protein